MHNKITTLNHKFQVPAHAKIEPQTQTPTQTLSLKPGNAALNCLTHHFSFMQGIQKRPNASIEEFAQGIKLYVFGREGLKPRD